MIVPRSFTATLPAPSGSRSLTLTSVTKSPATQRGSSVASNRLISSSRSCSTHPSLFSRVRNRAANRQAGSALRTSVAFRQAHCLHLRQPFVKPTAVHSRHGRFARFYKSSPVEAAGQAAAVELALHLSRVAQVAGDPAALTKRTPLVMLLLCGRRVAHRCRRWQRRSGEACSHP